MTLKEYKFSLGFKALRVLKDEFSKNLSTLEYDPTDIVLLYYCGAKAAGLEVTLDDVYNHIDQNTKKYTEAQNEVQRFTSEVFELVAEAKN